MRRIKIPSFFATIVIVTVLASIFLSGCGNTHKEDSAESVPLKKGTVCSQVVSADDHDSQIQNATVIFFNTQTGEEISVITDAMGYFKKFLPTGTYSLMVKAEGYEDFNWPNVTDLPDRIEMKPHSPGQQKRLASATVFRDGLKLKEYYFTYNNCGQITSCAIYYYEDGNIGGQYTNRFEYDEHGNLILLEWDSSQRTCYQYDYDSSGRITKYSYTAYYGDQPSDLGTYLLSYDEQGRVVKRCSEYGNAIEDFSYDESGKIIFESSELDWGDGHFSDTGIYDYTYDPIVIATNTSESEEYGNSSEKSIRIVPHWVCKGLSFNVDYSAIFVEDSSGYLLRVTDCDGEDICVFTYEEALTEQSDVAQCYSQVLQKYPQTSTHSYTSDGETRRYQYDTNYTLYDIDKDGTPELIVQEDLSNYYVYTIGDAGAVLCGEFYWDYSDCLYAYDGNGLIVYEGGMGSMHLEYLWLYTLSDGVLDSTDAIISTEEYTTDEFYAYLENCPPIDNFLPITDESLLENQ